VELPRLPAVVAPVEFGPHVPGRVALAAQHAENPSVGQHVPARVEPPVSAEGVGEILPGFAGAGAEGIFLGRDEGQEVEDRAVVGVSIHQKFTYH
jgi:hypothetical protein